MNERIIVLVTSCYFLLLSKAVDPGPDPDPHGFVFIFPTGSASRSKN